MKVAALDLGSNSFGLLVGRARGDGSVEKLTSQKEPVRLGQAVAASGAIPEAAFERALAVVRGFCDTARELEAECVAAVGTSALRDATNGGEFVRAVAKRFGLGVQLVSGDEEARLVYSGARSALADLPERMLVIDLGGGSAELAVGDGDQCLAVESLPLGFLRVARELELTSTLNGAAVARVNARVRETADGVLGRLVAFMPRAFVLSGGTARTLGRVAAALGVRELTGTELRRLASHLAARDPSHLTVLGVEASRASVFGVAMVVLAALVELTGANAVRVSPAGLREGIVLRETKNRAPAAAKVSVRIWAA